MENNPFFLSHGLSQLGTGWGTDEKALIEILGHRTAAQRAEIAVAYEGLYNESLLDRLHAELSGDFRVIPRFRLVCVDSIPLSSIADPT